MGVPVASMKWIKSATATADGVASVGGAITDSSVQGNIIADEDMSFFDTVTGAQAEAPNDFTEYRVAYIKNTQPVPGTDTGQNDASVVSVYLVRAPDKLKRRTGIGGAETGNAMPVISILVGNVDVAAPAVNEAGGAITETAPAALPVRNGVKLTASDFIEPRGTNEGDRYNIPANKASFTHGTKNNEGVLTDGVTFLAKAAGTAGNSITVSLDTSNNGVSVSGTAVTISLAAASSPADIKAEVAGNTDAAALIEVLTAGSTNISSIGTTSLAGGSGSVIRAGRWVPVWIKRTYPAYSNPPADDDVEFSLGVRWDSRE